MATGRSSSPSRRTTVSVGSVTRSGASPTAARPSGVVMRRFTASGERPVAAPTRTGRSDAEASAAACPIASKTDSTYGATSSPIPADPGTAELERDGHRVVVRGPDGDVLHGQPGRLGDDRPRPRRLCVVEDAEVDVHDRGAVTVLALGHEDGRPELEVVALRDLVELVAPAPGRDPDRRRDVGAADAGAHALRRHDARVLPMRRVLSAARSTSPADTSSRAT